MWVLTYNDRNICFFACAVYQWYAINCVRFFATLPKKSVSEIHAKVGCLKVATGVLLGILEGAQPAALATSAASGQAVGIPAPLNLQITEVPPTGSLSPDHPGK